MKTLVVILILLFAIPLWSATYYVSPTGNNSNDGKSTGAPFLTFAKFTTVAVPGDTLLVRGGTYVEYYRPYTITGTRTLPIVISAYPNETPIIDGENNVPTGGTSYGLFHIEGNYFYISGLEIKNSKGSGIVLSGKGNRASSLHVHHTFSTGIQAGGDSSIVEDCLVDTVCLENLNGICYLNGVLIGQWGMGISANRGGSGGNDDTTDYAIIRRNIVHDSWGEGISTYEAKHTLMEDNTVYDSFSANFYISDACYVKAQRNLVYGTKVIPGRIENGMQGRMDGILISNERGHPVSTCDTIINNIVKGTRRCLVVGATTTNTLIANNTFVNCVASNIAQMTNVYLWDGTGQYTFQNNIIMQDGVLPVIDYDHTQETVTMNHNLWSKTPSDGSGAGDIVGDAQLAQIGDTSATNLQRAYFTPLVGSPAIDAGTNLGFSFVGSAPDMGAMEYTPYVPPSVSTGRILLVRNR